jgi:RNA polymerase sigma factor (TIGR02999 family)
MPYPGPVRLTPSPCDVGTRQLDTIRLNAAATDGSRDAPLQRGRRHALPRVMDPTSRVRGIHVSAPSVLPVAIEPTSALFTLVYARLKAMASRHRIRAGQPISVCTTEIVHELFLKMSGDQGPSFSRELEFFAYAARAMRNVLIDLARRRMSLKGGGDLIRVDITDPAVGAVSFEPAQALELDAALRALQADAPRAAQVMELHYFAGLSLERVAELTGSSPRTVDRDWRYARSFLAVRVSA